MTRHLVIVESPTKARTLARFLGEGYVVESSVGHVRDLPANARQIPAKHRGEGWARLGVNVEEGFRPLYVVPPEKKKTVAKLRKSLKDAEDLLLATDEDREGEAISWHLVEVLKPRVPVRRMVFHEITKRAILASLEHTREIDRGLVGAQEARRIIDRLYGYEVSPILWRKIAPRLSAGRVQSVAIHMIVERERARMRFVSAAFWDLLGKFETEAGEAFQARLQSVAGKRVAAGKDFDPDTGKVKRRNVVVLDEDEARALVRALEGTGFTILSAEEKPFTRTPAPPFTTSTLQQEGNRKLRFNARRTMKAAQRLYETGYITYMRTDSVTLSAEAIRLTRAAIERTYGADYLAPKPRAYRTKVKNAQEAHEAIRPAGPKIRTVAEVRRRLGGDEARIYELIWKRTMACQMRSARGRRLTVLVRGEAGDREVVFLAKGNVIDFPGFLRAYVEGRDQQNGAPEIGEVVLPPVAEGDRVAARKIEPEEHLTTPPPRLTEATLVKTLEESGIGRPSTYATIIDTIQRREYTFKKGQALVPTFTAFAVVALMEQHLADLIDRAFTARMEDRLDRIARGEAEALPYLREFYHGDGSPGLRPLLDRVVEDIDARKVCTISLPGTDAVVRVGRYGPYLERGEGRAPIPAGTCPDEMTAERVEEMLSAGERAERPIGRHPETGEPIYVKRGRFGPYVQLGDPDPAAKGKGRKKPRTVSLLRGMTPETLDPETALRLLSLPRLLGKDPEGREVWACHGRYGPYVRREKESRSLDPEDDLFAIGLDRALALFRRKKGRRARRPRTTLKVFAKVEAVGGADVTILEGAWGPYVTDGKVNATLPKSVTDPAALTLEEALALLEKKRAAKPRRR